MQKWDEKKRITLAEKNIKDPEWLSNQGLGKPSLEPEESVKLRDSKNYNYFVILPDDKFKVTLLVCLTVKGFWELVISILVFTVCIITPWRLAFVAADDAVWDVIWYTVNSFFVIDMILNFFMAYYDDEYNLIDDIKVRSPILKTH